MAPLQASSFKIHVSLLIQQSLKFTNLSRSVFYGCVIGCHCTELLKHTVLFCANHESRFVEIVGLGQPEKQCARRIFPEVQLHNVSQGRSPGTERHCPCHSVIGYKWHTVALRASAHAHAHCPYGATLQKINVQHVEPPCYTGAADRFQTTFLTRFYVLLIITILSKIFRDQRSQ